MNDHLRITLYKSKYLNENFSGYFLKFVLDNNVQETEKYDKKDVDIYKSFFFEIPNGKKQISIDIIAISKTMIIFNSDVNF